MIMRPRVLPPPDPEKLKETHRCYQSFLNFITPEMQYVAYQLKNGQAQFVVGAPTLGVLVLSLNKKFGIPREPCLFMELSHHRDYNPQ